MPGAWFRIWSTLPAETTECKIVAYNVDLNEMENCGAFGDMKHTFTECRASQEKFRILTVLLEKYLGKMFGWDEIVFLSLHHFDGKKLKLSIWTTVHALKFVFENRDASVMDMLCHLKKELFWHQALERWFCGQKQMMEMAELMDGMIRTHA